MRRLSWGQWFAIAWLLVFTIGIGDAVAHHRSLGELVFQVAGAVLFAVVWVWFWLVVMPARRPRLTMVGLLLLVGIASALIDSNGGRWGPIWAFPTVAVGFALRPRYAIPAIFAMTAAAVASIYANQASYGPSLQSQLPTPSPPSPL
jgi:hypothetical protein